MEPLIEELRRYKQEQEKNLEDGEKILDISFYGKINLSKKDDDLSNEKQEEIYLIKKEIDGKIQLEFKANEGTIATIGEDNQVIITPQYKELINENEFLIQLQKIMPISLEKLEKLQKEEQQLKENAFEEDMKENEQGTIKYKPNPKDAKIDMKSKITETKTFEDLVPEVKEKGIVDVRVRRIDQTKFKFIGIDKDGNQLELETLQQTEGTNPAQEVIEVNEDGSEVKKDTVMTMLKIEKGENEGRENEGFTVTLGAYGIPEINYYRRDETENKYTSIPVNLENTNQKIVQTDVQEYMEKGRNTSVNDNIERAEQRIESSKKEETVLENIDDDLYNDKMVEVDDTEILIRKAAKRCKINDIEGFKKRLEYTKGDTIQEKIDNLEEEINEEYSRHNERTLA